MAQPVLIPPSYVDKNLLPVRVVLPGNEQIEGLVALSPSATYHEGPETLLDLLNSSLRVIPVIRNADGAVLLVSRLAIEWVEVEPNVDRVLVRPQLRVDTREERVQVRQFDGRLCEGLVAMDLPEHNNRVSDFLNLSDDFFMVEVRTGTMAFNKTRIAGVRVYETSMPPVSVL
jgi:hypothetical protein